MKAVEEVNKIHRKNGNNKGIARVEGQQRVHMFVDYYDCFNSRVEESCVIIGDKRYNRLLDHIEGDSNTISRIGLEARKVVYAEGVKQSRTPTKSE